MAAATTPESGNVGLVVPHTLTPVIVNEQGCYGVKDIATLNPWGAVSINESLIPFQNEMDSDRLIMAAKHATQITPTDANEPPLVATGGEWIVPQISSTRFVQRAKKDGIVEEVIPNKTMTVRYNDGTKEIFDILPRLSRSKMGVYINLEMNPVLQGSKVKKNQVIASTKNFKHGIYSSGTNARIAVMPFEGMEHEDSYVIHENLGNKMTRDILKEIVIIIPPEAKVLSLEKEIGKNITNKDVLVEFAYHEDLENYLEMNDLNILDDNEESNTNGLFSKGRDTVKVLGIAGEISDIKIFINNKNSIDRTIVNFHNDMVKDTKQIIAKLATNAKNDDELLKCTDNLKLSFIRTGGHKLKGGVEFQGAKIVYYIKQKEPLVVGDKISGRFG